MNSDLEFQRRISQIPFLGIGLSVDVYSPDLRKLMAALDHDGLSCAYLEIFKASQGALQEIRSRFPSMVLNYHAEGLWVSQPDWETAYPVKEELETAADHLKVLGSYWLNQECASKQMVGYSFGTYVPPLFTEASAAVTASNAASMQAKLDARMGKVPDRLPLLLLETPPLTYFRFGDLSYPEFFRCLAESCSCGLVLDIGHVWTVFRYSGAWRHGSLPEFLDTFLQTFPLERVVQIHLAGLDRHPTLDPEKPLNPTDPSDSRSLPYWIDSHGASIPEVLWEMLDRVLQSPELVNLKGMALEVDTKPIGMIVDEFSRFQKQFEWWAKEQISREINSVQPNPGKFPGAEVGRPDESKVVQELVHEYQQYVDAVTGRVNSRQKSLEENTEESEHHLEKYVHEYLPHEVMVWGGDLRDMFPHTIQGLEEQEIDLSSLVTRWFSSPRAVQEPYDFFLLKIKYFVEFVERTCPSLSELVSQEAKGLREGYTLANNLL
jgi:uncharacterized protein (UPF0276 family)